MKQNPLTRLVISLSVMSIAIAVSIESAVAQNRFSCDTKQMSTTFEGERATVPIIRWTDRSFPPPFTPEQRCQIVSDRFQKFDNNGTLKYLKGDRINNLPDGLLVTFKPGTDANDILVMGNG